jgi:hypothetical protein
MSAGQLLLRGRKARRPVPSAIATDWKALGNGSASMGVQARTVGVHRTPSPRHSSRAGTGPSTLRIAEKNARKNEKNHQAISYGVLDWKLLMTFRDGVDWIGSKECETRFLLTRIVDKRVERSRRPSLDWWHSSWLT